MSTGEALFLTLVISAMVAFMATLAWVTYGGKSDPRKRRTSRRARQHHQTAELR
jgi:hypothetical protein